jgi:hypothetical protein
MENEVIRILRREQLRRGEKLKKNLFTAEDPSAPLRTGSKDAEENDKPNCGFGNPDLGFERYHKR